MTATANALPTATAIDRALKELEAVIDSDESTKAEVLEAHRFWKLHHRTQAALTQRDQRHAN